MQNMWENGKIIIETYFRMFIGEKYSFFLLYLFMCSVSTFFVKNNKKYLMLLFYSVLVMILMCNPLVASILCDYVLDEVYWRVFWLLPIYIVIAYGSVRIIQFSRWKNVKRVLTCLLVFLMCICGKFIFTKDNFVRADNMYKIPDYAYEVCKALEDESIVKILAPDDLVVWLRLYDGRYNLLYGRGELTSKIETDKTELRNLTLQDMWDVPQITALAKEKGCNIIIRDKTKTLSCDLEEYQYYCIDETSYYTIYKLDTEEENAENS